MAYKLKIIPQELLKEYVKQVPKNLKRDFDALKDAEYLLILLVFILQYPQFFQAK